ncbi:MULTISPECIES: 3'-5' exonuclease [Bradyrhizobium]|uniref:3'-5' exonuclease n=1 Tax=Bradyrhizobium TaxID=374 RepID=UPI00159A2A52|nr:hypothetical protein [Bradyrhizobium sp. WBAH30]MDD1546891.1 hypothetical protein [Bradyrhizobium sp. WBAH41]MDD1560577.1 hypothetical protein [Bradyrhizobium sp. WBAH23]MDD1567983.1 hypothetical protein [Bradyrhizobium sp. WBAH33]MDD1593963.1 hypothetical protein [Bradyrhizobium sp. WBAH42]NRB91608.1 hypothetical protein [Bradyrhizobium sp. WBAH10]QCJ93091.1 hypothetical protein DAA57_35110 [Bradyrhizobium yuanmingense]
MCLERPKSRSEFRRLLTKLSESEWPTSLTRTLKWYRGHLKQKCEDRLESKLTDLEQLTVLGRQFGSCREFLADFVLDIPAAAERRFSEGNPDDVLTLSTIHSAKGMEWRSVTILNMMEGCIPSVRAKSRAALEEERRLLYVAMTRARDRLELIYPRRNFQVGPRNIPTAIVFSRPSQLMGAVGQPSSRSRYSSSFRRYIWNVSELLLESGQGLASSV